MDDAPVLTATGRAWSDWFELLDERDAQALTHKEIARMLRDEFGVPAWWSQTVTVEYERYIGRREPGQRLSGDFATTVSKTLPGTMDEAFDRWLDLLPSGHDAPAFDGVPFSGTPSISRTKKWRYWRVRLADGAKVTAYVSAKTDGEAALLAVETDKLAGKAEVGRWKAYWKAYLAAM
jgi:hypothetical protein